MKKFRIYNHVKDVYYDVPFGLKMHNSMFVDSLIKRSRNIRSGQNKLWNRWCSDSVSRIINIEATGTIFSDSLIKKRLEYLNSHPDYKLDINPQNRIVFLNFENGDKSSQGGVNYASKIWSDNALGDDNYLVLVECIQKFSDEKRTNGTVDMVFALTNRTSQKLYNGIMSGYDGRIYHRLYPVSTIVILVRIASELSLYTDITYMLPETQYYPSVVQPKDIVYEEKLKRIKLI